QLQVTYQQEQKAQTQRIETEKARETAEQQHQLVEAVIGVQVSEQNKNAAKLRGEGQKLELEEIAQGQQAQADVLGQDRVLTITLVQQILKTIQEKPEIVSLIGRLVPQTVVSTGGQGTGLHSAAAILGALINNGGGATPALTGQSSRNENECRGSMMAHPIVYGSAGSNHVWSARLALAEKGVTHELVDVPFGAHREQPHLSRQPFAKVPGFEHDGFALYETQAIMRYVDERFAGTPL